VPLYNFVATIDVRNYTWQFHRSGLHDHIGKTLTITGESKTVANGKIRPYVFWKPTDMMICIAVYFFYCFCSSGSNSVSNQPAKVSLVLIFRKAAINSLIPCHQQDAPQNKTKSSGAIPTLILRPVFH
jgi:hypothetical protein